jgi:hypothetical protein
MSMRNLAPTLALILALQPVAAGAQQFLPQGVGLPAQSVVGNARQNPDDAVAVPFAQLKAALGVPQAQTCSSHNWFSSISALGIFGCAQPSFSDLLGSLPTPGTSSLGGVFSASCASGGQFVQSINVDGSETCATPPAATPAATKADEQAGTSAVVVTTPSQQQQHDSAAKAWIDFVGSTGGSNAAYNATVVRTSAGGYTVSFTTPFASANYACHGSTTTNFSYVSFGSQAAGSIFVVTAVSNTAADAALIHIVCFGRQ